MTEPSSGPEPAPSPDHGPEGDTSGHEPDRVSPHRLEVWAVTGIGEVGRADDVAGMVAEAVRAQGDELRDGDVVVVTQKIVSKAEGAMVAVDPDDPDAHRELVESQSVRVLRRRGDLTITETRHGFVCANAGVDLSNVARGWAALLPADADRSARRIRDGLRARAGVEVGVVVSDTFGRAWRRGLTDVAIGAAGLAALVDLRGTEDSLGRELHATEVALVDELAGAAELVMGKADRVPVAVIRGGPAWWFRPGNVVQELVRPPAEDLFR